MFNRIKLRIRDIGTIKKLISGATSQAHKNGEDEPGAEHFLLSAFDLPDGTARRVFERIDVDPDKFQMAITKQYNDALSNIGVEVNDADICSDPITTDRILQKSKPSGEMVMKRLYALKSHDKDKPLLGAHVVKVIAEMEHGVAARSLRAMGIDKNLLCAAVKEELESIS